jgi:hypothetical protein
VDLLKDRLPGPLEDAQAHPRMVVAWHLAEPAHIALNGSQPSISHGGAPGDEDST